MRRHILGLALLILLPLLCLPVARELKTHHHHLADQLTQAGQQFALGNEEAGARLLQDAFRLWEEKRRFTAAFIHHAPLDSIDCDFAAAKAADSDTLGTQCAQLAQQIYAIADSNQLNWWDIL